MLTTYYEFGREFVKKYSGARRFIGRVTGDADVVADLLIMNPSEAGAALRRIRPPSGECDRRAAGENWGDVDLNLVDQTLIQRLPQDVAAAFDQHACDFVRA